jgi:predicted membrane protein
MVLPLVLWLVPVVRRSWLGGAVISLAVLAGVFAMRWNVVLGGQAESKVSSNTVVTTSVPLTGFDSVQTVLGVFGVAFLLFLLFSWLFPWRHASEATPASPLPPGPSAPAGTTAIPRGQDPSLLPGAGLSSTSSQGGA